MSVCIYSVIFCLIFCIICNVYNIIIDSKGWDQLSSGCSGTDQLQPTDSGNGHISPLAAWKSV